MIQIFRQALHISLRCFTPVLRRFWPWFITLAIISIGVEEYSYQFQRAIEGLDSPPMLLVAGVLFASLFWEVSSGALVILLASLGTRDVLHQQKSSPTRLMTTTMMPLTIETLRSLGWALLWSFALLIPGLIRYIQYSFVPYIVLFDPRYENGELDALEHSRYLIRGHTGAIAGLIALYFVLLSGFSLLVTGSSIFKNPVATLCSHGLYQLLSLMLSIFLYATYESLNQARSQNLDAIRQESIRTV
jgi:hypothetical protein